MCVCVCVCVRVCVCVCDCMCTLCLAMGVQLVDGGGHWCHGGRRSCLLRDCDVH